jgi:hypothetical protein
MRAVMLCTLALSTLCLLPLLMQAGGCSYRRAPERPAASEEEASTYCPPQGFSYEGEWITGEITTFADDVIFMLYDGYRASFFRGATGTPCVSTWESLYWYPILDSASGGGETSQAPGATDFAQFVGSDLYFDAQMPSWAGYFVSSELWTQQQGTHAVDPVEAGVLTSIHGGRFSWRSIQNRQDDVENHPGVPRLHDVWASTAELGLLWEVPQSNGWGLRWYRINPDFGTVAEVFDFNVCGAVQKTRLIHRPLKCQSLVNVSGRPTQGGQFDVVAVFENRNSSSVTVAFQRLSMDGKVESGSRSEIKVEEAGDAALGVRKCLTSSAIGWQGGRAIVSVLVPARDAEGVEFVKQSEQMLLLKSTYLCDERGSVGVDIPLFVSSDVAMGSDGSIFSAAALNYMERSRVLSFGLPFGVKTGSATVDDLSEGVGDIQVTTVGRGGCYLVIDDAQSVNRESGALSVKYFVKCAGVGRN